MSVEDVKARINDVSELWSPLMSAGCTLDLVRRRVNGASPDQLLIAALVALHEKNQRIAELKDGIEGILGEVDDWIDERKTADSEAINALHGRLDDWRTEP